MQNTGTVPPPHLLVVEPAYYISKEEGFQELDYTTKDKLLPKGYSYCRCEEYHLGELNYTVFRTQLIWDHMYMYVVCTSLKFRYKYRCTCTYQMHGDVRHCTELYL